MVNNNSREIQQSVIAILKTDNKLRAVEVARQNGTFKILWAKSGSENDLDWQAFASRCGLTIKANPQEQIVSDKNVVVGYDSTGTAFYQVIVPVVEEKEISSIVELQAESRFLLPADQLELAWRTSKLNGNQMIITIAAARRHSIQGFIDKVRFLRPARAILDSEGIIKVWKELFFGLEQNVVIVNAGTQNTQICLAKNGLLCNAVTLDIGTVDFGESESQEETETIERLVRDAKSVVDLFGVDKQVDVPVIVLSDGSKTYETLAAFLKSAGLNARSSVPSVAKLKSDNELNLREIFEYRAPIGLAMLALNSKTDELNLFERLFKPFGEEVKKHWYFSPGITGAIAAVLVLLFAMVSYAVVAASPKAINNKLSNIGSDTDIKNRVEKQNYLKEVASQRADLLVLLTEITESGQTSQNPRSGQREATAPRPGPQPGPPGQSGIQLESFHFKKRQRVTISGQAQNKEQLENFEKSLSGNKDIKDIHLTVKSNTVSTSSQNRGSNRGSPNNAQGNIPQPMGPGGPGGPGNKGIPFTITFNYKNFTGSSR